MITYFIYEEEDTKKFKSTYDEFWEVGYKAPKKRKQPKPKKVKVPATCYEINIYNIVL